MLNIVPAFCCAAAREFIHLAFSRLISFKLSSDRRNYTCLSVAVLSCQRTDMLLALDRILRNFKFLEA